MNRRDDIMVEIPTWMKAENEKFDANEKRGKEQEEERLRQAVEDGMFVSKNSLDCWKIFTDEIKTNALSLKELKGQDLDGSASMVGPSSCHLVINFRSLICPNQTSLTFHYSSSGIRITPPFGSTGKETSWEFGRLLDGSGVGILAEGRVVTPKEFAERVFKIAMGNARRPPIAV